MIKDNSIDVTSALLAVDWVAQNHPIAANEVDVDSELLVALQLALIAEQQSVWERLILITGVRYGKKLWQFVRDTGRNSEVLVDAIIEVENQVNNG